jgi:hypothetical protein
MRLICVLVLVVGACHPECTCGADSRVVPAKCEPVCKTPFCTTACANATVPIRCENPVCQTKCPSDQCESDSCPDCEIHCLQPVNCYPVGFGACHIECAALQCSWLCVKPAPDCVCESSACAFTFLSSSSSSSLAALSTLVLLLLVLVFSP